MSNLVCLLKKKLSSHTFFSCQLTDVIRYEQMQETEDGVVLRF